MSYIDINTILNYHYTLDAKSIIESIKKEIRENKKSYLNNSSIHLPETISSIRDLYFSHKNLRSGNYITQKKIIGEVMHYKDTKDLKKIEKKILLIESADPGYDFIFSKRIKGLITKYGGQNSHMSIRASELGLPAAIGVGEEIFNSLKKKKYITLDCLNKKLY